MAVIAINTVVNVTTDASVICVGVRLGVAVSTGEYCVIARIGVAGRAHTIRSAVIQREIRVIPTRGNPRACVVAGGARGWETCRRMIRIRGAAVICLVA